jgi:quercetin dioxygenase-like cupin family protein
MQPPQRRDFRLPGIASQYLPKDVVVPMPEDDKLWVRRPGGRLFLPHLFDFAGGITVNLLKFPHAGTVNRHLHDGPVFSYTISGSWRYPEHDWIAKPGTFVWEPPGEIHTLTVEDETMAFFVMHGGQTLFDENDQPSGYANVLTLLEACDTYYREIGLGPDYIKQFIR